jgi:hypothetical protein
LSYSPARNKQTNERGLIEQFVAGADPTGIQDRAIVRLENGSFTSWYLGEVEETGDALRRYDFTDEINLDDLPVTDLDEPAEAEVEVVAEVVAEAGPADDGEAVYDTAVEAITPLRGNKPKGAKPTDAQSLEDAAQIAGQ